MYFGEDYLYKVYSLERIICTQYVVHKTNTSKQHRKLNFGMQSYFNPTKINNSLNGVKTNNSTSKKHRKLKFSISTQIKK